MPTLRLEQLTGAHRPAGDEEVYEYCPVCGAGGWHFAVNRRTGLWNCVAGRHRGGGGRVRDYHSLPVSSISILSTEIQETPEEVVLPSTVPIAENSPAYRYLRKRNISLDTCRLLGLRDWKEKGRILIPFQNERGEIIGYTGRDYFGTSYLRYYSPSNRVLYIPDQTTGTAEEKEYPQVALVEGQLDAVALFQCARIFGLRWRAVCLGGRGVPARLQRELSRIVRGRRVLLWLDADDPGETGALGLGQLVGAHADAVLVYSQEWAQKAPGLPQDRRSGEDAIPGGPPGEKARAKDPAAHSPEELARILQEIEGRWPVSNS